MPNKPIDQQLSSLLMATYQELGETQLPHLENRVFTNRNIKLARIAAVGFDMDFTLAQYKQEALDTLTMKLALETMVKDNGYDASIRNIPYTPGFAIRGLVLDTELGNVLKMDKFRYVSMAYHGLKPLDSAKKALLYNNSERINFATGRYRPVDTLFELLETYLYAAIIGYLESELKQEVNYGKLYKDLRSSVDLCHRDGSLKDEIMAHPETYICDDLLLIPALHSFKLSGKRLFVITNSEAKYTEFVLDYLFRNSAPFFSGWRSCFDIVCAFSCKPAFFQEGSEPQLHAEKPCLFFSGGNLDFVESRLGISGDQILYVGDHIYGDILKSKHNSTWRTCIIVPELNFQIRAEEGTKTFLAQLLANETRRKQLSMELNWQRSQVYDLQQFKEAEADELELESLKRIDDRIVTMNDQLEANHKELSALLYESRTLRGQISSAFNLYWGRLFKTGGQLSLFAEQIRDYACIYTSSVSNFNFYGSSAYLESVVTPMPHERALFSFADLNFDVSMNSESLPEVKAEMTSAEW